MRKEALPHRPCVEARGAPELTVHRTAPLPHLKRIILPQVVRVGI